MSGAVLASAGASAAAAVQLTPIIMVATVLNGQGFRLNRNGVLETRVENTYTARPGQWSPIRSSTIGDIYEARLDSSDSWLVSNANQWYVLSSNREWFASGAPLAYTGTLRIRLAGTTNPLVSVAVSVTNNQ